MTAVSATTLTQFDAKFDSLAAPIQALQGYLDSEGVGPHIRNITKVLASECEGFFNPNPHISGKYSGVMAFIDGGWCQEEAYNAWIRHQPCEYPGQRIAGERCPDRQYECCDKESLCNVGLDLRDYKLREMNKFFNTGAVGKLRLCAPRLFRDIAEPVVTMMDRGGEHIKFGDRPGIFQCWRGPGAAFYSLDQQYSDRKARLDLGPPLAEEVDYRRGIAGSESDGCFQSAVPRKEKEFAELKAEIGATLPDTNNAEMKEAMRGIAPFQERVDGFMKAVEKVENGKDQGAGQPA